VGYLQPWSDAMCEMHHRVSATNRASSNYILLAGILGALGLF
jgi:hypothetical protein